MTHVGMIFECGPYGADIQVCQLLVERLNQEIQLSTVTLDNKPNLVTECGEATAISKLLSQPTRKVKMADEKKVERLQNPKKRLNKLFKEHTGRAYIDRQHAVQIAKEINLSKLERRCSTFARFVEKVTIK